MKSDVERAAGSALLRNYGNFFKRQELELSSIGKRTVAFENCSSGSGVIRAEFSTQEAVQAVELTFSDNVLYTKILSVFTSLCIEVDELRNEATTRHFPVLAVCGERGADAGCSASEVAAVCEAAAFAQRVQQTLSNFCSQLLHLYNKKLVKLQGVELHYLVSAVAELCALLAETDLMLGGGSLGRRWGATVAALRLHQHTRTHTRRARALLDAAQELQQKLFGDRVFENALDSVQRVRDAAGADRGLSGELAAYVRAATTRLDVAAAEPHTPDLMHKCLKLNALAVLHLRLFAPEDKKLFKSLLELNTKVHSVPVSGGRVWFADQFLQRHLPAACATNARLLQAVGAGRRAALVAAHAHSARDLAALERAAADWTVSIGRACAGTEQVTATQIQQLAGVLLAGLQLAGQIRHFAEWTLSVSCASGSPLPRSTLSAALRGAAALHATRRALAAQHAGVTRAAAAVVQHLLYRAGAALGATRARLAADSRRLDEVSCALVAWRAARGAATRGRLTAATVALAFVPSTSVPELAGGRVASLLHDTAALADFAPTIRRLCDTGWLYWHADAIAACFGRVYLIRSDIRARFVFQMLDDCGRMLRDVEGVVGGDFSTKFADDVKKYMDEGIVKPTSQVIETDLRLHVHSHLRQDDLDPFVGDAIKRSLLVSSDFHHLDTRMSLMPAVEHYLSTVYYNLTTLVLADKRTYSEMRQMASFKFRLQLVEDDLPTQTLEQGIDVLEIMRNIHVFVSRYRYNLNNQLFVEDSSESKFLNSLTIRHVANSIRAHGTGVMNTTVNFTYQFLRKKFFTFSQFMFDEQIKSRLAKDQKASRDNITRGETPYSFKSAEKFNKGIRNLGVNDEGQSYLDLFRGLITEIGNAMGYVRMIRSGGRHCCSKATAFLPSLEETEYSRALCERDGLSEVTRVAAENFDRTIEGLVNNFTGGTEYFKLLVDVFAPTFRSPKNVHLRNFFMIVPPLTLNFVENMILCKDKMTKKDKAGAAFTDDGFAMGVAYILKLLDQDSALDSLRWWECVEAHASASEAELRARASGGEHLRRALALSERRLLVLRREFELLHYGFSSARVFFCCGA